MSAYAARSWTGRAQTARIAKMRSKRRGTNANGAKGTAFPQVRVAQLSRRGRNRPRFAWDRPMQDRSIPLILATAAFLGVLLWRVRPALSWRQRRASREALREARSRIDSAIDEPARAL